MLRHLPPSARPRLSSKARLRFDRHAGRYLLLYPEAGLDLNRSAAEIARLCTGERTVIEIARSMACRYCESHREEIYRDVHRFLGMLAARGLLQDLS